MKISKKLALLSALLIFQTASAAPVDDELARISSERYDDRVEIFDPNATNEPAVNPREDQQRREAELEAERQRLENERQRIEAERQRLEEEHRRQLELERQQQLEADRQRQLEAERQKAQENNPPAVTLPNPVTNFASYDEIVSALNFTPLYVPKKSGYTITSMAAIDNRLAEVNYTRRWEPNVVLQIRTYRRAAGEELKDVSGVNGAKWRINVVNGVNVYVAKIDETHHAAAWAVGNYTFSAYVENLSFAAFHSFVADELVDLSQHYYLGS